MGFIPGHGTFQSRPDEHWRLRMNGLTNTPCEGTAEQGRGGSGSGGSTHRLGWPPAAVVMLVVALAGCDTGPMDPATSEVNTVGAPSADQGAGPEGDSPVFAMMVASMPELSAQDLGRGITIEQLAARWLGHGTSRFERATRLAGPNPQPPISAWLQAAGQMLGQAVQSFDTGNYQAAIRQAQASVKKSNRVIDALQERPGPPDLEARAEAAIQAARQALAEAEALTGPAPSDRVMAALERASDLLNEAGQAFEAGDFAKAIRLARESHGLSRAIIRHLSA